jgi:hypothetical protein
LEVSFSSLYFSSFSSYWISARYKWRRHGFLPPTTGGGVSPCTGSPRGHLMRCQSAAGFMKPYEGVRAWIFTSFLLFSCTGMAAQGVCS